MKTIYCLLAVLALVQRTSAQHPRIELAANKTTSLVFASPIVHVDRGSKDLLVQRVKEASHILLAKAATPGFTPTNLSVITADGNLYSFSVSYDTLPKEWVYTIAPPSEVSVEAVTKRVLSMAPLLGSLQKKAGGVKMQVRGIYVREGTLFYQLHFINTTPIDYDVDALRFYIRDKRGEKRTAQQELVLTPLSLALPVEKIAGHSSLTTAVALPKFTVPDAKYFGIELLERSGGRHLLLKVANKHLFKAKPITDLQ